MNIQLLNRREVCYLLDIHPSTLWRLIKQGKFPSPLHVGAQLRRWERSAVEAALEQLRRAS